MAEKDDREAKEQSNLIKTLIKKTGDATESSRNSIKKLGGNLNDAFRSTFADSPILGSIADIGESMATDVLGFFKGGEGDSIEMTAMDQATNEREKIELELVKTKEEIQNLMKSGKADSDDMVALLDNQNGLTKDLLNASAVEEEIKTLQDKFDNTSNEIALLRDSGETSEERRENERKADALLKVQQDMAKKLGMLTDQKKDSDKDKGGFWNWISKNLVLTFTGLFAFLKSPITKMAGFFKPMLGIFGKMIRFLGPIGLALGVVIGAFQGFSKAIDIFGKNATFMEKIAATLGGILSAFTFGLVDTKTFAVWIDNFLGFFRDELMPAFDTIGDYVGAVINNFKAIFSFIKTLFTGDADEISASFGTLITSFKDMFINFLVMIGKISETLITLPIAMIKKIWEGMEKVGDWIAERGKIIGTLIYDGVMTMFDLVIDKLKGIGDWLKDRVKAIGGFLGKIFGFDDSEEDKKKKINSGEALYNKLKGNGLTDNAAFFGNDDTMSKEDISKLSMAENDKLQKYLKSSGNADDKSAIIKDLMAQQDKMKREEMKADKTATGNAIIDASNRTNVNNNYAAPKPSASSFDKTVPG